MDILTTWLVPAIVLALTAFVASTVAGVTGFGGAAILLPVLVLVFGVRDAIPILTVAQLIGNASRVWFNRKEVVWPLIGWFSLGAVPLALLGGLLFAQAPLSLLTRFVGVFLLLMVVWRHLRKKPVYRPTMKSFTFIGAGFSFLSALVGSVGPILAPFFLAYGLVRGAYIGTEAMSTVVMHLTKLVAYGGAAALTGGAVLAGLALGPIMLAGSYTGKRILERLPERFFIVLIELVLLISGLTLLVTG